MANHVNSLLTEEWLLLFTTCSHSGHIIIFFVLTSISPSFFFLLFASFFVDIIVTRLRFVTSFTLLLLSYNIYKHPCIYTYCAELWELILYSLISKIYIYIYFFTNDSHKTMLTNGNIMLHSSYDNLSLKTPILASTTTNTNPIFDELQGLAYISLSCYI